MRVSKAVQKISLWVLFIGMIYATCDMYLCVRHITKNSFIMVDSLDVIKYNITIIEARYDLEQAREDLERAEKALEDYKWLDDLDLFDLKPEIHIDTNKNPRILM